MKLQMFACMWCAALACGGVSVHAMEALASVPQQDGLLCDTHRQCKPQGVGAII